MSVTDNKHVSHSEYFNAPNVDSLDIAPMWTLNRVQPLVFWPDERLHQSCLEVLAFGKGTDQIIYDLVATMLDKKGIGIAAPQIGWMLNIIIIDQLWEETTNPIVLINPKIVEITVEELFSTNEGCLSVPGYYEDRGRPSGVVIEYKTPKNEKKVIEFRGLNAFVVQHELEHLEGKVFVDDLSKLKKDRVLTKMKKTLKFGR